MTEAVTKYLEDFSLKENGQLPLFNAAESRTLVEKIDRGGISATYYSNEFWTARQRQSSSLHEISYRACFKPQLPRFFMELLTVPGQTVYDPFAGRGTTTIEAALLDRTPLANDINPLSRILSEPRLDVPSLEKVEKRLKIIDLDEPEASEIDLSMFYHPKTEAELLVLRKYLLSRKDAGLEDRIDRWIRMVATNRLTGHSKGFFSVYTMPPNQAVSAERQELINRKYKQKPEYRDVKALIFKKTASLLKGLTDKEYERLKNAGRQARFFENDAAKTPEIPAESVDLTVTSPPFLNIVQYSKDNWLRCWFNGIDTKRVEERITTAASLSEWSRVMGSVFDELHRITRPGGWVAFEVGEVRGGKVNLDETVVPLGVQSGFECVGVIVNRQMFTKTSNIWGVKNNRSGTNSNRIVLFKKSQPIGRTT